MNLIAITIKLPGAWVSDYGADMDRAELKLSPSLSLLVFVIYRTDGPPAIRVLLRGATIGYFDRGSHVADTIQEIVSVAAKHISCAILVGEPIDLEVMPDWLKQSVSLELRTRISSAIDVASRLGSVPQDVMDAAWTMEEYLRTRPTVKHDRVIPALMELGMPCDWVEDETQ